MRQLFNEAFWIDTIQQIYIFLNYGQKVSMGIFIAPQNWKKYTNILIQKIDDKNFDVLQNKDSIEIYHNGNHASFKKATSNSCGYRYNGLFLDADISVEDMYTIYFPMELPM